MCACARVSISGDGGRANFVRNDVPGIGPVHSQTFDQSNVQAADFIHTTNTLHLLTNNCVAHNSGGYARINSLATLNCQHDASIRI